MAVFVTHIFQRRSTVHPPQHPFRIPLYWRDITADVSLALPRLNPSAHAAV